MKRIILSTLIIATFATFSYGQCSPDMSVTSGISPDTAVGMSVSYVGQPYSEIFSFVVPSDTSVNGLPSAPISHVKLDDVVGLPSNYTYACNPANCEFPGGSIKCVDMYSTGNPTSSQIGSYPITIKATGYTLLLGNPVSAGQTIYDGYYLVISASVGIEEGIQHVANGEMKHLISYPNPTSGNTTIEFAMGYSSPVNFTVSNLLGEIVFNETKTANKGLNNFKFDANTVANGVYIYSITDGINTISKKLIVNK